MKKIIFFSLQWLLCLLLLGCSENNLELEEISDVSQSTSLNLSLIEDYISLKHPKEVRSRSSNILPYINDGDTLMYIANYSNGWEVFSNDVRLPMVIMRSQKGESPINGKNEVFNSLFDNIVSNLKEAYKQPRYSNDSIHNSWKPILNLKKKAPLTRSSNDIRWVGQALEVSKNEYTPQGGRLTTQWDQNYPYNLYTPFIDSNNLSHYRVGCGSIAVGQFLYYWYETKNQKFYIPTKATYNSEINKYEFSDFDYVSIDKLESLGNNLKSEEETMSQTAIYLSYIAQRLNTNYYTYLNNSFGSTGLIDIGHLLNEFLDISSPTSNIKGIENDYLASLLMDGKPCFVAATEGQMYLENGTMRGGHVFIVDYVNIEKEDWYDCYATPKPNGFETDIEEPSDLPGLSRDEMLKKFHDASFEYSYSLETIWYKINWGWGGENNEIEINFAPTIELTHDNNKVILSNYSAYHY